MLIGGVNKSAPGGIKNIKSDNDGAIHGVRYQKGTLIDSKSFSFLASDPVNTNQELIFILPTEKVGDYIVAITNPSTETALNGFASTIRTGKFPSNVGDVFAPIAAARVNAGKVWYYDASANSYTDLTTAFNNATGNDVVLPGHAAAEVGDWLGIGKYTRYSRIFINVGTARTDVATYIAEYWNGSAWAALTDFIDSSNYLANSGLQVIHFNAPNDWARLAINSETAPGFYYIRIRCLTASTQGNAGAITQGQLNAGTKAISQDNIVYGAGAGGNQLKVTLYNTVAIGASATLAGAGPFTGIVDLYSLL